MRYFDFKQLMLILRRINKAFKEFLERDGELDLIIPDRVLFYRLMAPPSEKKKRREDGEFAAFHWPKKTNYKICNLANRVHVYLMNEFPETDKQTQAFSHMVLGDRKELYLVMDEMN